MASIASALFSCLLLDLAPYLSAADKGRALRFRSGEGLSIPADTTGPQYAAYALLRSSFKKFRDEVDQAKTAAAAYQLFMDANNACGAWEPCESELGPYDEVVIGEFRMALWRFFNLEGYDLLDTQGILAGVDFGPGSAPGAVEKDFASKIGASRLTASSPYLIKLFEAWVDRHSARVDCELARYLLIGPPEVVHAVKIAAVPKTREVARLVKSEPLLNMLFQKGIQKVMEERLRQYYGIDFSTQPSFNAELARIGSIDGSYSTIDLKSASDYISVQMCREFLPPSIFRWLERTRSEMAYIPVDGEDHCVKLSMMATMGNAWCFPLQTIIFACAVEAAYKSIGLPFARKAQCWVRYKAEDASWEVLKEPGTWGVFGDDIVVRKEAYPTVIRLLKYLGGKPNLDKSFNEGNFRESCGSDWLNGYNVRGVYIKSLVTPQSRAVAYNRLSAWASRTGIKLGTTLSYLRQVCRSDRAPTVPVWENDDAGVKLPYVDCPGTQVLQDRESEVGPHCLLPVDGPLPYGLGKIERWRSWRNIPGSILYKAWRPVKEGYSVYDEDASGQDGRINPFGLYLAFLHGRVRGGFVSTRREDEEPTAYRVVKEVAPGWDYLPSWKAHEYGSMERWMRFGQPS